MLSFMHIACLVYNYISFIFPTAYLSLCTVIQSVNVLIGLVLASDLQSEYLNDILVTALFERVIWL